MDFCPPTSHKFKIYSLYSRLKERKGGREREREGGVEGERERVRKGGIEREREGGRGRGKGVE